MRVRCVCLCAPAQGERDSESESVIWSSVTPSAIRKSGVADGHQLSVSSQTVVSSAYSSDAVWLGALPNASRVWETDAAQTQSTFETSRPSTRICAQLRRRSRCLCAYARAGPYVSEICRSALSWAVFLTLNWISCEWRQRQRNIDSFSERRERERATPFQ